MPGVLRLATDAGLTAKVIRSAFRRTGQFPLDHSVIDRSQLVSDHVTVCSVEDLDPTDICLIMDCTEEPGKLNITFTIETIHFQ